jgi:hypothetical protein
VRYGPFLCGARPGRVCSARGDRVQLFHFFATSKWRDEAQIRGQTDQLLVNVLSVMCELDEDEIPAVKAVRDRDLHVSDCSLLSKGFTAAPLCTVLHFMLLRKYVSNPALYAAHLKQHPDALPVGARRNLPSRSAACWVRSLGVSAF